jgi:hypothetical protein
MGNPHLPWGVNQPLLGLDVYQWMEANLVIGDPNHPFLNASGVTFPGAPVIAIGFNDYLGWTHTVNSIKNADLYELELVNGGYRWDGGVLPLEQRTTNIKIRQQDGSYLTQTIVIQSSVHGPVVAQNGNKALALRVAGLDAPSVVTQYWEMMLSHHLWEFIIANSELQIPIFNVIYADRDGRIMYVFGGSSRCALAERTTTGLVSCQGTPHPPSGLKLYPGRVFRKRSIRPAALCIIPTSRPGSQLSLASFCRASFRVTLHPIRHFSVRKRVLCICNRGPAFQ